RPARRAPLRNLELAQNLALRGVGLDERHRSVLITEIQPSVRVRHRRRAIARPALPWPRALARKKINAERKPVVLPMPAVQEITHEHYAAMMIPQIVRILFPHLFGLQSA